MSPTPETTTTIATAAPTTATEGEDGPLLLLPLKTPQEVLLQENRSKLPQILLDHLQWFSDQTDGFDEVKCLETPPTMNDLKRRLKEARQLKLQQQQQQQQQQQESQEMADNNSDGDKPSLSAAVMRKPTMLPVKHPLTEERLQEILDKNNKNNNKKEKDEAVNMSQADVDYLCEAVQGYHPGATKGPLENWLFDSFLSSAEAIIPDQLYLGGIQTAHNKELLIDKLGITRVLCVGGRALAFGADKYVPPFPDDIQEYKVIDVDDTEKTADADALGNCFEEAVAFIEEALKQQQQQQEQQQKVYVHCMAGASRSASVVCAYLIWKYRESALTVQDALELVRSARPVATPNAAFVAQLERWYIKQQQQLQEESTELPAKRKAES